MTLKSLCALASAMAAVFAAPASAWAETDTQSIQLEQKLEIPGATLKAGTYAFSVEDRLRDRAIVRITAKGNDKHYLLLTVPNGKLGSTVRSGLIFFGPAAKKEILRGWACPGCAAPLEVVYPKAEAAKITGENGDPVLAVDPEYDKLPANLSPDDMKVVTLWLLTPQRITADHRGEGVSAEKYTDAQVAEASPRQAADAAAASETQTRASLREPQPRMPKTATNTFALGLSGLLLTMAGFLSWVLRRRTGSVK
jgi:hypothetical protein